MNTGKVLYTEVDLWHRISQGDELAFKEVFLRYWEKLYAIAYNRLKSKQDAEDVVQDVLSGLWHRRAEVVIEDLEHYLAAAVKFSVFYKIRQQQQLAKRKAAYQTISQPTYTLTPADNLLFNAFLIELEKEKNRLPEKCRLVFHYSRELGMTHKEIAQELNLSTKTVEAHISRAIKQLRTAFKGPKSFIFF